MQLTIMGDTQFNCGGRSIKQGLIAVDIVSHCECSPGCPTLYAEDFNKTSVDEASKVSVLWQHIHVRATACLQFYTVVRGVQGRGQQPCCSPAT